MMHTAVLSVICSLFSRASEMIGDHMGDVYSIMLSVYVLYVWRRVSFCCPHEVPVSALKILSVLFAFCLVA